MTPFIALVPGYGEITIDFDDLLNTGTVRYQVDGARMHGVVVAVPSGSWRRPGPLHLVYGDGPPPQTDIGCDGYRSRAERPTVNGLRLLGRTAITIAADRQGARQPVRAIDLRSPVLCEAPNGIRLAPQRTADRVAGILAALARHHVGRPRDELDQLRAAQDAARRTTRHAAATS